MPPKLSARVLSGKSGKEALRCLKRRVSDAVFKSLMADLERSLVA